VGDYGTKEFTWTEVNGTCSDASTITVNFYEQPVSDAGPDQILEFDFSTRLAGNVPEFGTGQWSLIRGSGQFGDENDPGTEVTGLSLGENEFSWIISSWVCEDVSDNMVIRVNDIITPTVITPNGDGQNDFLEFPGIDQIQNNEIIIYNRWGTEVYRSPDYQNDWDGRDSRGRELIPDTYYYILRLSPERIIKSFIEIRR
jgi:gliding motility-associated-like protein